MSCIRSDPRDVCDVQVRTEVCNCCFTSIEVGLASTLVHCCVIQEWYLRIDLISFCITKSAKHCRRLPDLKCYCCYFQAEKRRFMLKSELERCIPSSSFSLYLVLLLPGSSSNQRRIVKSLLYSSS
jgi:hypothetical protein